MLPSSDYSNILSSISSIEKDIEEYEKEMSDEEMYELLSTDGMLVKRPILVTGECVLVGFRENEWKEALLINK